MSTGSLSNPIELVTIGISTGGPQALQTLLPRLPATLPVGIVIVQHMPLGFTKPLAERLDGLCALRVKEAQAGDRIEPGTVFIAPAGRHALLERQGDAALIRLADHRDPRTWHKPSADVLMASVAIVYGARALGIIMTGMGRDGTAGATAMKQAGALIWAQDEASCTIYGMPRAAIEANVVDRVLPLDRIAAEITRLTSGVHQS